MDEFEQMLGEVVLFELPTFEDSVAFRTRLRPRWSGWSAEDEKVWLFAVELKTSEDVPLLLREAQDLLGELRVPAIRFVLDGRIYVLEAAQAQAA